MNRNDIITQLRTLERQATAKIDETLRRLESLKSDLVLLQDTINISETVGQKDLDYIAEFWLPGLVGDWSKDK